MGITIHYRATHLKHTVPDVLDRAERLANAFKQQGETIGLPIEIRRQSPFCLMVDVAGCETLDFCFMSAKEIQHEHDTENYSYIYNVLTNDGKKALDAGYRIDEYPQNERYFCSSFCKTQFAEKLVAHRYIAEIIRLVMGYAIEAYVDDEGDYYHTGKIQDAEKSISSLGDMIASLGGQFQALGYEVQGNDTKIKGRKSKKV